MADSGNNQLEFKNVFENHYGALVRRLTLMLHDKSAAEDVAQEAFIQLLKTGADSLTTPERWLLKVGTNLALNYLRGEKNRRARELRESGDYFYLNRWGAHFTVEEEVDRRQDLAECQKIMGRISPRDRQILILRFSGFSYAEIAETLQIERNLVRTILARALARFKREYQQSVSAFERPGGEMRCVLI